MEKHGKASQPIRASRWRLMVSLLMLAALVLATGCRKEVESQKFDVQVLFTSADMVAKHAESMEALGKRMVEHGQKAQNRDWVADGEHWQGDAANLKQLSKKMTNVAAHLQGNPTLAKEVNIRGVIADGQTIVAEGKAVTEHGQVMIELAKVLERTARQAGNAELLGDAEAALPSSKDFIEAGEVVTRAGQKLIDFGQDMLRSIGGK